MATETKTFYPSAHTDETDATVVNPTNPVGKGPNNSTYAGIRPRAKNREGYVFWPFDVSEIPDKAEITSVSCEVKAAVGNSSVTVGLRLYSGTTAKGTANKVTSAEGNIYTLSGAVFTRSELENIRLKFGVTTTTTGPSYFGKFYGSGLTVAYTYRAEKFMLKLSGAWHDIARVFKKVNGIWVEQTELSGVVDDGVRYQNGGEIISPKKTVTITGSGDATYAYVTINGTNYTTATTVEVDTGDEISITVYGNGSSYPGYVTLNGETVLNTSGQYTHTVDSACTVRLSVAEVGKFMQGSAEISTS